MKRMILCWVALAILCLNLLRAEWLQTQGPYTGNVQALAVSGSTVFAGTAGGGVFISYDNGAHWTVHQLMGEDVRTLVVNGDTIFAGTNGDGVFRSAIDGQSWSAVNTGLDNVWIRSLAVMGTNLFAGTGGGVFLSTNKGTSWSAASAALPGVTVRTLAVHGSYLFAGMHWPGGGDAVYMSTDNGSNWVATNLAGQAVNTLFVSDTNIFAGTYYGVYVSGDNGSNWTHAITGLTNTAVLAIAGNSSGVFAGTSGGVFYSSDIGENWTQAGNGLTDYTAQALSVHDTLLFVGTDRGGVYRSTDNGSSWIPFNTGLNNSSVRAFSRHGASLYAGTDGHGVYRSTNNGAAWTETGLTAGNVQALASSTTNLFAGTHDGGIYRSTDDGAGWMQVNFGLTNFNVRALTVNGANLFAGTYGGGVFRSTNEGAVWALTGLTAGYVQALAVSGTTLFAGTISGGGYSGVYRSTDNGATWTQMITGLASPDVRAIATADGYVFAGTSLGVFRSSNNGAGWIEANSGLGGDFDITSLASGGSYLFAGSVPMGSGSGVARSTDDGVTWTQIHTGLPANINILALVSNGPDLLAGSLGMSAWRLTNVIPLLSLSTSSLSFGDVSLGSSKKDTVLITNSGGGLLTILNATPDQTGFTVSPTGASLASAASQKFIVSFAPPDTGTKSGNIILVHNAEGSPDTVSLSGKGAIPQFVASPETMSLGYVPPGSIKHDSLIVKNPGSMTLEITSVLTNDPELLVLPTSASIAVNDSQIFYVAFSPVASYFTRVDTIRFHDNGSGQHEVVCRAFNTITVTDTMLAGWNMVSVPVVAADFRKFAVYPAASSGAFAYSSGYQKQDTLEFGGGYWLKFDVAQGLDYTGLAEHSDTLSVISGWNMVGSVSSPVPVSSITSIPGGMDVSTFFGYSDGYVVSESVMPGKAYWVRVNVNGSLILSSSGSDTVANRIHIRQTSDLPPPPPDGKGVGPGRQLPQEFGLEQNYPNPFNPATAIRYQLPVASNVRLSVYNMLGQHIATLVDGIEQAGYKSVGFDAGKFSSGIYYYRIVAGNYTRTVKMLLLK